MTVGVDARTGPSTAGNGPRREALAFAGFTVWIVSGLVLDGWSHNTAKPETFFTPWHGLLYSGFLAAAAWGTMDGARQRRTGGAAPTLTDRWSRIGVGTFAVGMVGDFTWHQVFGIEVGVDALLSPTHLLLLTGGLLLATATLRAALGGTDVGVVPVVVSAAATSAVTGFFTMYLSAFRGSVAGSATAVTGRHGVEELRNIHGIGAVLVTTVVLLGPLLALGRTGRLPIGARTAMLTLAAVALSALDGFQRPALILAAVAAGLVADAVSASGRSDLAAIAATAVLWPTWFAALRLTGPMAFDAELWSGTCVLAVLLAIGLTLLTHLPGPPAADRADRTAAG